MLPVVLLLLLWGYYAVIKPTEWNLEPVHYINFHLAEVLKTSWSPILSAPFPSLQFPNYSNILIYYSFLALTSRSLLDYILAALVHLLTGEKACSMPAAMQTSCENPNNTNRWIWASEDKGWFGFVFIAASVITQSGSIENIVPH